MSPDEPSAQYRDFQPRGLLASAHVQSILTSGPWRRRKVRRQAADYLERGREEIIQADDGTRLLGYRHRPPAANRRGELAILLHGWEGSADSNYLLSTAVALDGAGFDTFRLNFRDHGPSHHLNVGLFHSCLLDEVLEVVGRVRRGFDEGPVFLVGFSLGGNFTLRIARNAPARGFALDRAVAVSPVIRPHHVLDALESGLSLYHHYFVYKWRRSLKVKQALYPERYQLEEWLRLRGLREQTDWLVEHLTEFPDLDAYLEGYSVAGDYLSGLEIPTRIITATDDPIIPISDIRGLPRPDALDIEILDRGGHCGFIENWRMDGWIERRLVAELTSAHQNR